MKNKSSKRGLVKWQIVTIFFLLWGLGIGFNVMTDFQLLGDLLLIGAILFAIAVMLKGPTKRHPKKLYTKNHVYLDDKLSHDIYTGTDL